MVIYLNEIPEEGASFTFTRQSGELNQSLNDLLHDSSYKVDFFIKPMGHGYELHGHGYAELPEMCSRCGLDIKLNIKAHFNEILMPKLKLDRTSKYSKLNHLSDNEQSEQDAVNVTEYTNNEFNVGDFVSEAFTLLVPTCPVAETDDKGKCQVCGVDVNNTKFGYDEEMGEETKKSPFDVLKNLKPVVKN